ncbi:hypothetical protein B0O99DRAFT_594774 [Bisporella sp. PMI_857]|nr:hypothetical protein B0O99DRAFT_594774 [Bisporella sp. PMI_857]
MPPQLKPSAHDPIFRSTVVGDADSMRRIMNALIRNLVNTPTPARFYPTNELDGERESIRWILTTIRQNRQATLLLEAVLRFTEYENRGDHDIVGAAMDLQNVATRAVLQSPDAGNRVAYGTRFQLYRARYPVVATDEEHAQYLQVRAPGAFVDPPIKSQNQAAIQPSASETSAPGTPAGKPSKKSSTTDLVTPPDRLQWLQNSSRAQRVKDGALQFQCGTCRIFRPESQYCDFNGRTRAYPKYCSECQRINLQKKARQRMRLEEERTGKEDGMDEVKDSEDELSEVEEMEDPFVLPSDEAP